MESLHGRYDLTPEQRFWPRVNKTDTCWLWTGPNGDGRYGSFMVDGRETRVHRWAYEHFVGPIPNGNQIDHACGVTLCVRPDHLRPLTPQQNVLAYHREQKPQVCKNGHPLTDENTVMRLGGTVRRCRECERTRKRAYKRRIAAAKPQKEPPTECRRGHAMSGENLVVLSSGKRVCRECRKRRKAEFHAKRKG